MSNLRSLNLALLLSTACAVNVVCAQQPSPNRVTVFISDVHLGIGKDAKGVWHPYEDFRWPDALKGFLSHLAQKYSEPVDLVILGDLVELWQPPAGIKCKPSGDLGCTVEETQQILRAVIAAHRSELEALGTFSKLKSNHVYVVPGNHDSALMVDSTWQLLAGAFGDSTVRVTRESSGLWVSRDGTVVGEHGHQIGEDVNSYPAWPKVTEAKDGKEFLRRPWGEQFVQTLFNDVEVRYPIVDNLTPESAGPKYHLAKSGAITVVANIARFLAFNLFETSLVQKLDVLGPGDDPSKPLPIDKARARSLGHALFVDALPTDDPARDLILANGAAGVALRAELDTLAKYKLSDEEVVQLCTQAIILKQARCRRTELNALAQAVIHSKRAVMEKHLRKILSTAPSAEYYVFGHTHQFEEPWDVSLGQSTVKVANTGAFQRVMDWTAFKTHINAAKNKNALDDFTNEQLPPCYSFVVVAQHHTPQVRLQRWFQPPNLLGEVVASTSDKCT